MPGKTLAAQDVCIPLPISVTCHSCCFLQNAGFAGCKRETTAQHFPFPGRAQGGVRDDNQFWKDRVSPHQLVWACGVCWLNSPVGVSLGARISKCSCLPCSWNLVLGCLAPLTLAPKLPGCTAVCLGHSPGSLVLTPGLLTEASLIRAKPGGPRDQWRMRGRCCTYSWWLSVRTWEKSCWNLWDPWGTLYFSTDRGEGLWAPRE